MRQVIDSVLIRLGQYEKVIRSYGLMGDHQTSVLKAAAELLAIEEARKTAEYEQAMRMQLEV